MLFLFAILRLLEGAVEELADEADDPACLKLAQELQALRNSAENATDEIHYSFLLKKFMYRSLGTSSLYKRSLSLSTPFRHNFVNFFLK